MLSAAQVAAGTVAPAGRGVDFAALRAREFARLDAHGCAYLDYAATALYGASQLAAHNALLADGVFGNPHSESAPSRGSAAVIEHARRQVLGWFDVDEATHEVCFTANASAASKLVAESYPFGPRGALVLAADNHNSINGAREYARRAGAAVRVLPRCPISRRAWVARWARCGSRSAWLTTGPISIAPWRSWPRSRREADVFAGMTRGPRG